MQRQTICLSLEVQVNLLQSVWKRLDKKLVTRDEGGCYLPQKPSLHSKSEEKKLILFPEHQGSQSDSAECLFGTHSKDAAPTQEV